MVHPPAVKYAPNPDWLSLRPWAHKFRAARWAVSKFQREKVYVKQTGNLRAWAASHSCSIIPTSGFPCTSDSPLWSINLATATLLSAAFWDTVPHFRVLFLLLPISRPLRYVYVPNEENSSKSLEMERIMREARLWLFSFFLSVGDLFQSFVRMRELCKGLYSSTYEDSINSKVKQYIREVKNSFIYSSLFWWGLFSVPQKNLQGHPMLSETNNSVDIVVLDTPRLRQ